MRGGDVQRIVDQIIDDITSRSALAGAASALAAIVVIAAWWFWTRRILRFRQTLDHVILVTGSRGKSSTVRLLHAVLATLGMATYAKTTGSKAAEIDTARVERPTRRFGVVSVLEMLASMERARLGQPRAHAMVMECMAVKPELIELIADRMTHPDIVIITNCQVDHLEEQGSSRAEIAASLAEAITPGSSVFSGETDQSARAVLVDRAEQCGASMTFVSEEDVSTRIRRELPDVHPQNIALITAVADLLRIPLDLAVTAMVSASREPHEYELWERQAQGLTLTYLDLGSLNDPESLIGIVERAEWPIDEPRIAVLVGRWDRPLRSLEFAGSQGAGFADGFILSGGPVHAVRKALISQGWDPARLRVVVHGTWWPRHWQRVVRLLARRTQPTTTRAMLISEENQHEALADAMRRFFLRGDRAGRMQLRVDHHVE